MKKSNFLILTVAVCVAVCHCAAAFAQIPYWENLGLYGGAGRMIAVDPNDADHIFLACGGGALYSYVTTDGGLDWTRLPINGGTTVYDPNEDQTVYLGRWRSTDNGLTWENLEDVGPIPADIAAVKPGDPDSLFSAGNENGQAKLYRSADGGQSWSDVTPAITQAFWSGIGGYIAFDAVDSNTMYVGFTRDFSLPSSDQGVYKSTDGGLNWTRKCVGDAWVVLTHPTESNILLANFNEGTPAAVLKSADGGDTWTTVLESGSSTMSVDPNNPSTVYLFGTDGCAKSTDFGSNWTAFALTGQVFWPTYALVPPTDSTVVLLCGPPNFGSFFRMSSALDSVVERSDGISEIDVVGGLVAQDGTHVVLGSERGVSVSSDAGETWTHVLGSTPHNPDTPLLVQTGGLCFDSETDQIVYWVGTGGDGIAVSDDGGLSWQRAPGGVDEFGGTYYNAVLESPDHSDRLLLAAFDGSTEDRSTAGLYVSDDGGETFIQTPLLAGFVNELAAEGDASYASRVPQPPSPSRLMYAAVGYSEDTGTRGLYWSEDSGETWSSRGLEDNLVRSIALDCEDGQIIYAAYTDPLDPERWEQLRRSDDGGLTWTDIYDPEWQGAGVMSLAASRTKPGWVYAGVTGQAGGYIAESHNYGRTWKIVAGPIERLHLVLAGSLYAGMDGGFYKYDPPWLDTDGDGLTDEDETRDLVPGIEGVQNPFDPQDPDSMGDDGDPNPDGVPDGRNDWDGDGVNNRTEFAFGYDPTDAESFPGLPLTSVFGLLAIAALLTGAGLFATAGRRHSNRCQH